MERIRTNLNESDLRNFSLLKNERQRIEYLFKIEGLYSNIKIKPKFETKCNIRSSKYREKGNEEFKKKHFYKSLELYTKSVFSASVSKDDNCLALALANRSAALFHIKRYRNAIIDINLALNNGYPKEMCLKLFERRGKCFWQTGEQDLAVKDWRLALDTALAYPGKFSNTLIKSLEKNLSSNCEKSRDKTLNSKHYSSSNLVDDSDKNVDEMTSESYSVQSNATKGRHVVAACDLDIGDTIICERPYASILFGTSRLYRCWHCSCLCYSLLACDCCNYIGFCSSACRDNSRSYHKEEVVLLQNLESGALERLGHLAFRIMLIAGFHKVNFLSVSSNGTINSPDDDEFGRIFALSSNNAKRTSDSWVDLSLMVMYLIKHLENINFFQGIPTQDTEIKTGVVILNLLEIVQCNAIAISEMKVRSEFCQCKPNDIGLGLYLKISMFNHSCNPCAEFNFKGNCCYVKALDKINKGSDVNCDYGPVYYLQSKEFRQRALKENYMFECNCEACGNDWQLFENLQGNQPSFKCSSCDQKCDTNLEGNEVGCRKCGQIQNMSDILTKLMTSFDKYCEIMHTVSPDHFQHAIPVFKEYLNMMRLHLCLPWRDYTSCQATLKQCFRLMGNKIPAITET